MYTQSNLEGDFSGQRALVNLRVKCRLENSEEGPKPIGLIWFCLLRATVGFIVWEHKIKIRKSFRNKWKKKEEKITFEMANVS